MKKLKMLIEGSNAEAKPVFVEGLDDFPDFPENNGTYIVKVQDGVVSFEEYTAPDFPDFPENNGTYIVKVQDGVVSFEEYTQPTIPLTKPSEDGTYVLTISEGVAQWVAQESGSEEE